MNESLLNSDRHPDAVAWATHSATHLSTNLTSQQPGTAFQPPSHLHEFEPKKTDSLRQTIHGRVLASPCLSTKTTFISTEPGTQKPAPSLVHSAMPRVPPLTSAPPSLSPSAAFCAKSGGGSCAAPLAAAVRQGLFDGEEEEARRVEEVWEAGRMRRRSP